MCVVKEIIFLLVLCFCDVCVFVCDVFDVYCVDCLIVGWCCVSVV